MSWGGIWDGGETLVTPTYPVLANATTSDAIRDRALDVIEALVPTYVPGSRFRRYLNEGDGDFVDWCEDNPASCFRRVQIRFDGTIATPEVSNTEHEERAVRLTTIIAYPHNARTGGRQALDRDTAIDRDADLLEGAIGLYSRPNFVPPFPDACWFAGDTTRVAGAAVDYLVVVGDFSFRRQRLT